MVIKMEYHHHRFMKFIVVVRASTKKNIPSSRSQAKPFSSHLGYYRSLSATLGFSQKLSVLFRFTPACFFQLIPNFPSSSPLCSLDHSLPPVETKRKHMIYPASLRRRG
ncbi:hypothetical protein PHYBLDRAFT_147652 [Phycomyces blakesleeanus NRRL 1555(-)]|uniref:Uncharacterized protein n=1 Tax=Phycomyces blakesleeanus (strain ATCC 8743b / DSM 1359 / FGSC 10004 / NBRC 33097 / NRRL 1555) TaxID=763407 RepID=A0A162TZP2_PHYB8|nr:hypothetical protein PHYBLDRAFT_147652 [Phycomyces blakesleeanus NRRL 1555(-)]OAD71143.1 hypothetical protein PHYBLDRAFT_147652 [Phycomyces blakesleeanus NRRL 1555(-)]|eukprot:XP_018289183.1 hypothetical protein PHYBLDRAFT_147652 [Phycomyces blakesleeanus NRRL 1555(-)]